MDFETRRKQIQEEFRRGYHSLEWDKNDYSESKQYRIVRDKNTLLLMRRFQERSYIEINKKRYSIDGKSMDHLKKYAQFDYLNDLAK